METKKSLNVKNSSDLTPDVSVADGHALNLRNIDQESQASNTQIMYTQDVLSLQEGEETPHHIASHKNGKAELYYHNVKMDQVAPMYSEKSEMR